MISLSTFQGFWKKILADIATKDILWLYLPTTSFEVGPFCENFHRTQIFLHLESILRAPSTWFFSNSHIMNHPVRFLLSPWPFYWNHESKISISQNFKYFQARLGPASVNWQEWHFCCQRSVRVDWVLVFTILWFHI